MPLGLKNAPPTYQWVVSMAFQDYLGIFMKSFLDNFNVFNDLKTYRDKLWLCFDKCKKNDISLDLVYFRVIVMYIVSKKGIFLDPICFFDNGQFVTTKNTKGHIGFQWHDPVLLLFHPWFCIHHDTNHQAVVKIWNFLLDAKMSNNTRNHQVTISERSAFGCY